ncbi:MAG: hydrogenase maturation protease [Acidobacteriota bacterium]|nr:hydrogenase maturation protease [Acidobacteriota bacterium]
MSDPGSARITGRRVLVGLGNRFRGDDRAGLEVAARLRERAPEDSEVVAIEGDPMALLDIFADAELVLVADAVATTVEPGTVYRFDASDGPIPGAIFGASTHAFGLAETIELARALGKLRARVLVYGITAAAFGAGDELSPAVASQIPVAVEQMLADLSLPGRQTSSSHQEEASHA